MRPWLDTMLAVDAAESAGDAAEAMRLIMTRQLDPEGRHFWRSCRIDRLCQVVMLGPDLPAWAISRWLVAQAHDHLGRPGNRRARRAGEIAVAARGGLAGLSGRREQDARSRIVDHDWVYRQAYTYELGGLSRFVRSYAAPALVARADHIHDWARAPMCGLRLVERGAGTTAWDRVDTGERLELPNIGSGALVAVGEWVIGRLVPVEDGVMFEGAPLVVPRPVAEQVATDPDCWIEAITTAHDDIETEGFQAGLAHDVHSAVWPIMLLDPAADVPPASELGARLARRTLDVARESLEARCVRDPDEVDLWACVRAALLDVEVVRRLPDVAGPDDVALLERLADLLVAPADVVCRDLVRRLRAAA